MKGAKGGIRDRFISLLYSNKNQEEKTIEEQALEEKELIKKHTSPTEIIDIADKPEEKIELLKEQKQIEDTLVIDKSEPSNKKDIHISSQTIDVPVIDNAVPSNSIDISKTISSTEDIPVIDNAVPSNERTTNNTQKQIIDTPIEDKEEPTREIKKETHTIGTIPTTNNAIGENHDVTIEAVEKEQDNAELGDIFLEKAIAASLERIIKEDIYELEQISYELEVLSQEEDEEVLKEETEKLKQRLDDLVRKFEEIKKEYYSSRNLEQFDIDKDLLYDIVLDYKDNVKDNNLVQFAEAEISAIESYITLLDQITAVEIYADELDKRIDDKLDLLGIRDEQFEEMKIQYENVEELASIIDKFNNQQESILKEIEKKISNSEQITHEIKRTTELVPHFDRLFESALIMTAASRIPPTPRGNMIKAAMTMRAISNAARFITTEERQKEITKVKYTDYSGDIKSIRGTIVDTLEKMDTAFNDIEAIREKFKHDCGEYASQIKEYDDFMKNLDRIEDELKLQKSIAIKYSKDFDKMLEKNNQKVKRLEMFDNAQAA